MIYASTNGLLDRVPVNRVREFEKEFTQTMTSRHPEALASLKAGKLDDSITGAIRQTVNDLMGSYAAA